jgi:hypothetical protein
MTSYGHTNPITRLSKITEWSIHIELEWLQADIPFEHVPDENVMYF